MARPEKEPSLGGIQEIDNQQQQLSVWYVFCCKPWLDNTSRSGSFVFERHLYYFWDMNSGY